MSSKGALTNKSHVEATYKYAQSNKDFVIGYISQYKIDSSDSMIHMTPGIQIDSTSDGLGQQYITPETAILERGVDIIIVGRGITSSPDKASTAKSYRDIAMSAYKQLVDKN